MTYTIDAEKIMDEEMFHDVISETLGFPEWYGKNLDALYDCLTDISEETELVIKNATYFNYNLGIYAGKLVSVFVEAEAANPNFTLTIE